VRFFINRCNITSILNPEKSQERERERGREREGERERGGGREKAIIATLTIADR